uniref:BPTI/Kunitz inhibitor domain-containing protein n=1 Tax=Romanomermis culicivorax TaxID=13658 RepID=A0A915IBZ4_ROMCU
MTRWYFEPVKKMCSKFLFSGCDGNDNNFLNEAECKTFCSTAPVRRPTYL